MVDICMIAASLCYPGSPGCLVGDCGQSHPLRTSSEVAKDFLDFGIVMPEVSRLLCCPCFPPLGRVMLLYHLPYPARAVESLQEVIVSLVFQLLQVKVSLHKVRQPSNLGVGSIGNVATGITDLEDEICFALGSEFPRGNLYGVM